MSLETNRFKFGEFLFDAKEKALFREGKSVPITPKAFELLLVLVKNHGHLVEKDELLRAVWADSFVEEGNLAYTMRLLRVALDDDKKEPRFIETVPKRGYRFVAEVRRVEIEDKFSAENQPETKHSKPRVQPNHHFTVERLGNVLAVADWQSKTQEISVEETDAQPNLHLTAPARRVLFGREREIAAAENLLRGAGARLITLTGAGGSGKTSVARAVAGNCLPDFADGVFFVELAPVFNPDLLMGEIAKALDVKDAGDKSLLENLKAFLRERRILLVLDNFEQILSAAPFVAELLSYTAQLKILITSRAALRLNEEHELVIPPLEIPPRDVSAEKLKNYSSVQMFFARAQAAKPGFVLSDENAAAIAEICARLDGLPLAIELAAARAKLLSPEAILRRLENRLELLTAARDDDLPARQRTMRDTIAWSFELLGEEEKTLFKRLSIFAGGFTVEAAEAIGGAARVLDGLEALADSHLLRQIETDDDETRLLMLETIREFAAEKLAEDGSEENAARRHHAVFFLNYARQIEREIMGERQASLLDRMEAERDNFRAALDFWRDGEGENELKLAAALAPLWTFRGYLSEGIKRLDESLNRNPNAAPAVRAKALTWLGQLIWVKGDYVRAIEVCEEGLRLAREINYPIIAALALFVLGMSRWYQFGDAERSITCLEESLSLYRRENYDSGVVFACVVLAAIYQTKGDLARAKRFLDESMTAAGRTNNNLARSIALVNYGRLKFAEGDYRQAKRLCRESLRLREELSDRWGLAQCLEPLTAIAVIEGNPRRAAKLLGAIDVLLETLGASPPLIFRADHEPSINAARAALDEKTFGEAFAEGRRLSIKEIVKFALDEEETEDSRFEFFKIDANFPSSEAAFKSLGGYKTSLSPFAVKPLPKKSIWLAAVFLIVGLITTAFWYARSKSVKADAPILSAPFVSEKLSTNGKVLNAIVSPDGKNVVYTNGLNSEKQSVWVRQLESANNVEIIPPSDDIYYWLALSPDGNFLYFNRRPKSVLQQDIYRVSIFGGIPRKIISDTEGWMSISPDGALISFVRCPRTDEENCSLWTADAISGKNERKLAARPRPFRIGDNKFSPDGKRIAFAVGQSLNQANEFALMEIDLESGAQRELTKEKFFNIRSLAWLPENGGLLITASKIPNKHYRIWQISVEKGNIEPLTNDSESYSRLSLDKEAKILISTQFKQDFRLSVLSIENPSNQRALADASRVTFAPDGKIYFASIMSGNDEIWSTNPDGSGQRQLTNDAADDTFPLVSGDNKFIYFASNRTGAMQLWRMNTDGSNQMQITEKEGGLPLFISPDARWIYYLHGLNRNLWRVSVKGGAEELILNQRAANFAFSPDGLQVAFLKENTIEVVSPVDKKTVRTFHLADQKPGFDDVAWMPDGKGIAFISTETDENYYLRLQPTDGGTPQTIAALGNEVINSFAAAPDGRSFAVVKGGWRHDAVLLKGLK